MAFLVLLVSFVTVDFVTIKTWKAVMTKVEPESGSQDSPILQLEDFLPYQLNSAAEIVSRNFARIYGERYGLTRPEWRCLATTGQLRRTTATRIGAHSAMHKTKVSRAIFALEQRKWLKRETDPNDRRIEHISLTRAGFVVYEDLAATARAYEAELMLALGPAAQMLKTGLEAVEANLGGDKRR